MVSAARPSGTARAFWVEAPGRGAIRDEPLPEPGPGEALVRALVSGVSRGTESLVFRGRVPVSEHERMRCLHQAGSFPGPVKYGYASVGEVVSGSPALAGRRVFCLHPHQTAYVVPESELTPLPDGVPTDRAVLAANLETALNALWDARPQLGDTVSVVGAGVVGCLIAWLASGLRSVDVELIDVLPDRAMLAAALGAPFATPDGAKRERDLVFHASGRSEGLRTALSLAAAEATVLELSWFGDEPVTLPLGEAFHPRRLTLRSSQVGTLSPNARARFTRKSRLELALSLLTDPALDALVGEESPFESLPEAMKSLASSPGPLCHRVRYGG